MKKKEKMKLNLNLYSYGYSLNFLNLKIKKTNLIELINKHKLLELNGIELPIDTLFKSLSEFKKFYKLFASRYKFYVCFDNIENLNTYYLDCFNELNIKNIRVRMPQLNPTIYGGNKFLIRKYNSKFEEFKTILMKYKKYFIQNNFFFCIENHQDLNSYDLNKIVNELGSDFVAINWDIGNSVACGETPDDFYNNSSKYIKNIHLKDYNIFFNDRIIILNRVPFGKGFLKNISLSKFLNHKSSKSIELGAQISRKCYISNKNYWKYYDFKNINKVKFFNFIKNNKSENNQLSDFEKKYPTKLIKNNEFIDFVSSYNYIRDL